MLSNWDEREALLMRSKGQKMYSYAMQAGAQRAAAAVSGRLLSCAQTPIIQDSAPPEVLGYGGLEGGIRTRRPLGSSDTSF